MTVTLKATTKTMSWISAKKEDIDAAKIDHAAFTDRNSFR